MLTRHSGRSALQARNVETPVGELLDMAGLLDFVEFLLERLVVCLDGLVVLITTVGDFVSLIQG